MLPVSTPAKSRIVSGKNRGFFHRKVERFFSPELFHLRLLIDPVIGVLVTIVLAVTSAVFRFRNRQPDARGDSSHRRKRILRIRNIVRNQMMINLLPAFPLFLPGNDKPSANVAWRYTN